MLQNREVGGATMGADRPTATGQIVFGPWGYLNLAVPVAVVAVYVWALSLQLSDPLGAHWSWFALIVIVAISAMGWASRRFGAESNQRYRRGPRDLRYRTQQIAPFAVLAILLVAFLGIIVGAAGMTTAMNALACGVTLGLAPLYFQKPPPAGERADDVDSRSEERVHP
ncbi:hypothetical protein [Leifsonia aquatica]|uniref:hypothetical protein n=1 Tax=Leifsonia aquatica TaxID=144185 RepID=UPI003802C1DF